ncbi:nicotinate-nucleotide adenylyltransferase [Leucothrix pacifica]|uniref:Probable nicotinate-nucleotide adenylyltransferase n=1 Tax=Leucothrix pacifica TaxID=1247513 RepID=A0A317CPH8_9GAMM|nr:nicotinate-nucleotide adenylyltransferase [Leucothrix pacifica]PWQ98212.1 nicotinic acid mononucleotide adenylyltransferase [Leucothrix pacifica]
MIGVRGGTFDPIHIGHLRATQEVAEALSANGTADSSLQRIHLIPGNIPPHRPQTLASAEQRLEMVRLATQNNDLFVPDDRELQRDGASYTVDTLRSLRKDVGNECSICLIIGMDAFLSFTTWHKWKTIITLAHLVVTSRPDYTAQPLQAWAQALQTENTLDLHAQPAGKLFFVETTALSISATDIRHQQAEGRSIRYLVPDAVYDYIQQKHLYRTP